MSRRQRVARPVPALHELAPLPWRTDLHIEPGIVFDAAGKPIVAVDQWHDLPDQTVHAIAEAIVVAVNATVGNEAKAAFDASVGSGGGRP